MLSSPLEKRMDLYFLSYPLLYGMSATLIRAFFLAKVLSHVKVIDSNHLWNLLQERILDREDFTIYAIGDCL